MTREDAGFEGSSTVAAALRRDHSALVATVERCADRVVDGWPDAVAADRTAVVEPLSEALDAAGVLDRFPGVLADAVDAAGYEPAAEPVAAPPYVVVTSRGPLLRATVADGRLLVRFDVFVVERTGDGTRYRRAPGDPLTVLFR